MAKLEDVLRLCAGAKAAVIPGALALFLVFLLRRKANPWCLVIAFAFGGLGAFSLNSSILRNLPAVLPEGQATARTAAQAWTSAFVEAAIPEEFAKGIWILVILLGWRQYLGGHGALLGGLVGLGFAVRENLGFGLQLAEWRPLPSLSHGVWGVIMGSLFQATAEMPSRRWRAIALAFLPTILLHGLLDATIFLVEVEEAHLGLGPEAELPDDVFSLKLFLLMLSTWFVELLSTMWAIWVVHKVHKLPDPAPDAEAV